MIKMHLNKYLEYSTLCNLKKRTEINQLLVFFALHLNAFLDIYYVCLPSNEK